MHLTKENIGEAFNLANDLYKFGVQQKNKTLIIQSHVYRAGAFDFIGNNEQARIYYERALSLLDDIEQLDVKEGLCRMAGKFFLKFDSQAAYYWLTKSINYGRFKSIRIGSDEDKRNISKEFENFFPLIVIAALNNKQYSDAFYYANQRKSQLFIESLRFGNIKPSESLVQHSTLFSEERVILDRLSSDSFSVPSDIEKMDNRLEQIYDEIEIFDPEYVSLRRGRGIDKESVIKSINAIGTNVVFLEFHIFHKVTLIFLISNNELKVFNIDIQKSDLEKLVKDCNIDILSGNDIFENISLIRLSDILVTPIDSYIKTGSPLIIIPDGQLYHFPFQLLVCDGTPLGWTNPISVLPFSSVIPYLRFEHQQFNRVVSIGVAEGNDEAISISDIFKEPRCKLEINANSSSLSEYFNCDILHLSCHGKFQPGDPLSSSLIFNDKELTVRDIFKLRFDVGLFTLSACETGIQSLAGNEFVGFTQALLHAGAQSLLVSLWKVDIDATNELMRLFYNHLCNCNNRAEALRLAQFELSQQPGFTAPYFWAPFRYVGL